MLKKLKTSSMPDVPPYVVPPDISDAVAAMEKLVVETEIDLNNPMFANLEDAPPGEAAAPPPSEDKEAAPAPEAEGGPAES